ncbi:hypothetical protein BDV95DRAFT_277165 [Massariosphaeria phaeospora]|uniref:Uncharacterized protein n=1 Tax=Massariosphaeria phaeospora TaxID=100035 RepID=A0A7C8IBN5_9PLEO|nr:hypothetical protein BDV95DRAFT_277165 [Massariosphaeria phaeospora]
MPEGVEDLVPGGVEAGQAEAGVEEEGLHRLVRPAVLVDRQVDGRVMLQNGQGNWQGSGHGSGQSNVQGSGFAGGQQAGFGGDHGGAQPGYVQAAGGGVFSFAPSMSGRGGFGWGRGRGRGSNHQGPHAFAASPNPAPPLNSTPVALDPRRFFPPHGTYVDQPDIPVTLGHTRVYPDCLNCGQVRGNTEEHPVDWKLCRVPCQFCRNTHTGFACTRLYASESWWRTHNNRTPDGVQIRPSETQRAILARDNAFFRNFPAPLTREVVYMKRKASAMQDPLVEWEREKFKRQSLEKAMQTESGKVVQASQRATTALAKELETREENVQIVSRQQEIEKEKEALAKRVEEQALRMEEYASRIAKLERQVGGEVTNPARAITVAPAGRDALPATSGVVPLDQPTIKTEEDAEVDALFSVSPMGTPDSLKRN